MQRKHIAFLSVLAAILCLCAWADDTPDNDVALQIKIEAADNTRGALRGIRTLQPETRLIFSTAPIKNYDQRPSVASSPTLQSLSTCVLLC
jgi:hypothetical protein